MHVVVKSAKEDTISLPEQLMIRLNLREGDEVKTTIDGRILRLTPLDQFLTLRGILRDDEDFDAAMKLLEKTWQQWTTPDSA